MSELVGPSGQIRIRAAREDDVATIFGFICELADYEKLRHEVVATEASLRATLFGAQPAAEVLIAEEVGADAEAEADDKGEHGLAGLAVALQRSEQLVVRLYVRGRVL